MSIFKAVIIMCLSAILAFFGIGNKNEHILDGPGMVNKPAWKSFDISRSDSYAQYNFWFTVTENDEGAFVTGECRSDDGEIFLEENGIKLTVSTISELRSLKLDELSDVKEESDSEISIGDEIILDESYVKLTLEYEVYGKVEKNASMDISLEIFELLSPYIIK